jgi:peptidoglycan biosynthesis protein MviN/MurJ (putative lipid II flippase)
MLGRLGIILAGSLAVKLAASWLLIGPMGHNGLALATSIAWLSSFLVMTLDLKRTAGLSFISGSRKWALTSFLALAFTIGFWYLIAYVWRSVGGYTLLERGLRLTAIGASGMGIYLALGLLFKTPETLRLREAFFSRARRLLSRS